MKSSTRDHLCLAGLVMLLISLAAFFLSSGLFGDFGEVVKIMSVVAFVCAMVLLAVGMIGSDS